MKKSKMKKLKEYKREYEYVFSGSRVMDRKCNLSKVSFVGDIPKTANEYAKLYRSAFDLFQSALFDSMVKMEWLSRRFIYSGQRRTGRYGNGVIYDTAAGVFVRNIVSRDKRLIFGRTFGYNKVVTYFDDFFPNFDLGNPFEEEYLYPFKNIGLEYLTIVYDMDERIEILKMADDRDMNYGEFIDYIMNYVLCFNNEHGERYDVVFRDEIPHVRKSKKYEGKQRFKAGNICTRE